MADADRDKDKDARLAAARQKAEQLKKRKAKKSGKKGEGAAPTAEAPETAEAAEAGEAPGTTETIEAADTTKTTETTEAAEATEATEAIEATEAAEVAEKDAGEGEDEKTTTTKEDDIAEAPVEETRPVETDRTEDAPAEASPAPSLAQQSKMRSASFRAGSISGAPLASPGPLSPDAVGVAGAETAADIYRKQMARIEELERENKRLAREAGDADKRWARAEEELAELREGDGGTAASRGGSEVDELKSKVTALERQNTQLQQQLSRAAGRHGSSPSISTADTAELEAQVASKTTTIETMELELSRLRAHAEKGTTSEKEQIAALADKLARAEGAAGAAQRELADAKHAMEQASKKAVQDSSERTSAETRIRTLEQDLSDARRERTDAVDKVDALEKKVATLTTLHREQDGRMGALRREKEALEAELAKAAATTTTTIPRGRKSIEGGGGLDDEGVDELEDEVRLRLERRVRELEGELHDLRRGAWRDRRRELEVVSSPSAAGFETVDLGATSPGGVAGSAHRRRPTATGGIGGLLASGLNALTGGGGADDQVGLLDDDDDFDEEAFRKAQEEMMMRRIERVREVKRGLKNWEGWRVDLVGLGGFGMGEVFEV